MIKNVKQKAPAERGYQKIRVTMMHRGYKKAIEKINGL